MSADALEEEFSAYSEPLPRRRRGSAVEALTKKREVPSKAVDSPLRAKRQRLEVEAHVERTSDGDGILTEGPSPEQPHKRKRDDPDRGFGGIWGNSKAEKAALAEQGGGGDPQENPEATSADASGEMSHLERRRLVIKEKKREEAKTRREFISGIKLRKRMFEIRLLPPKEQAEQFWDMLVETMYSNAQAAAAMVLPPCLEEKHIVPLPPGKCRELSSLPETLRSLFGERADECLKLASGSRRRGTPYVAIVCSSAQRCCDVYRALKPFNEPPCKHVLKLFAKHIEISTQLWQLSSVVCIVVGTPGRMLELAQRKALRLSHALLVVDMSRNRMEHNLLNYEPLRRELCELYLHNVHSHVLRDT
eukprot:RCo016305